MERKTMIRLLLLSSFYTAVVINCSPIIEPMKCLNFYDAAGYLFRTNLYSYEDAIQYCLEDARGKPPMPTEESWDEFLEYIRSQNTESYEGCWVGVKLTKLEDSTVDVVDSDGWDLTENQIGKIFNQSLEDLELGVGEERCVAYFPHRIDNSSSLFKLQLCTEGAKARVACRCISDIKKYSTVPSVEISSTTTSGMSTTTLTIDVNNSSNVLVKGRMAGGSNDIAVDEESEEAPAATTPLAVTIGLLAACCLLAATFFLVKKKGWNLQQRLSRRMPYSGRRRSTNGSIYRQGQEMSQMYRVENRPIHVYEEIILRNSDAANSQRVALVSASSSLTIPQLPPPEPPASSALEDYPIHREGGLSRAVDDGYLQPSFRRRDAIPGDVRSPPPVDANIFTFPLPKSKKKLLLPPPGQSDLKYASVETVQTMLDGEQPIDEEYLVDDEEAEVSEQNSHQFGNLVVEIPQEKASPSIPDSKRNSVLNSYVPISGGFPQKQHHRLCQNSDSSPVFLQTNYENERFLRTVTKVPPVKPKRRGLSTRIKAEETKTDDSVVYSRIPSTSREELYSKVKRKQDGIDETKAADRISAAYTPMHSDTLQRKKSAETVESSYCSDFSDEDTSVDQTEEVIENMAHEYQKIPNCGNTFISQPKMLSTTNTALTNSTLICYDIPTADDEDKA